MRMRDVFAATAVRKISGRAHVRVLDERVVLDRPDAVEPHLLGEDRLLDAVADRLALDVGRAVLDLGLEDHRELHAAERTPGRLGAHPGRAGTLAGPCRSTPITTSRSPGSSTPSRHACSRVRIRCRSRSRVGSVRWPTPVSPSATSTESSASSPTTSCTRPGSRRCGRRRRGRGSPPSSRPPRDRGRAWPRRCSCSRARRACTSTGASTAPWTRPTSEFVAPYGMFTAAEFALVARRHMHRYGTKPDALATVAAVIRNNGHVHPEAIYHGSRAVHPAGHPRQPHGRRPVPPPRLRHRRRRAVADSCSPGPTSRATHLATPVYVLGGNGDSGGTAYKNPPTWELGGNRRSDLGERHRRPAGGAQDCVPHRRPRARPTSTCASSTIPFSFEIIRQFEAFGFCGDGEGGDFVTSGTIEPGGQYPVTTDGGVMSYSHARRVGADAAAGDPRRRAAAGRRARRPRSPGPRSRCARTAVREPCSPT